jgi:RHS repeat-associated protein
MAILFQKINITIKASIMIEFILRKTALFLGFYIVTGMETLVATQSITLLPNTLIKTGSTFTAKISANAYNKPVFSNENFVFTRTYQTPLKDEKDIVSNKDVIESIVYFDGLGRPMQNISIKGSPNKQDIVTHICYDNFGRQDKDYLPYVDSAEAIASYRNNADVNTNNYYISNFPIDINGSIPNPFSQKKFEDSPLNRVMQQGAPGKDWTIGSGHEIKMDYETNTANEVKNYTVSTSLDANGVYMTIVTTNSSYVAGELYKTIIKDENWTGGNNNTTEEFKDKQGHVILKKTYGVSIVNGNPVNIAHETYYIYDNYGNLTYVLPPKAEGVITEPTLGNLCYQYRYDSRNRLIEKKLPGKEWEYIVYDKLDRPVLTQDANLRGLNKWMFTKYDAFSRPVYTGEYTNTDQIARATVQTLANDAVLFESKLTTPINITGTNVNYTNAAFPNTGIDLFTINYYDDYNFDRDGGTAITSYGITPIINAKGLATGSKVRVLGTTSWTTNVNYYDAKGRPIYSYNKNNYLATVNTFKSQLDFVGKVLETTTTHQKGATAEIKIVDAYTYDHVGRMLNQKQTINNQPPELIIANTYDSLGKLSNKGVGGKTTQSRLQIVNYGYNIRGWLKNINNANSIGSNLFAFQINYNDSASGKLYNGNISQTLWKTANTDSSLKSYLYTYDALNRLTQANDVSATNGGRYNEGLNYDMNGNIMNLTRLGHRDANATTFGNTDILAYTYTGNRLDKVEDSSGSTEGFNNKVNIPTEYTYDDNGNMKTDANKSITAIAYNYLNLPTKITFPSGTIDYIYDATGVKLRKVVNTGITTDYASGFIYENNALQFFSQPEGYVSHNSGTFNYIYQYKDHLGNIRLSYQDKNDDGVVNGSEIVEENNYYPFGLKHKGYNSVINGTEHKYKYNGKELQDEMGLNFYDYGARNYDPALGRWMNIDPLAEKSRRFSPYTYALNNPIYFIDPDGMEAKSPIFDSKTGSYLGNDSQGFLKGEVLFMDKEKFSNLKSESKNGVIDHNVAVDNSQSISELKSTESNMLLFNKATDFIDKTLYKFFYGENPTKELRGGSVQTASAELGIGSPYARPVDTEFGNYHNVGGNIDVITQSFDNRKTLNTAANIFSNFEHEFRGHGGRADFNISELPSSKNYDNLEHKAIYKMQMNSPNFKFTSGAYRQHILNANKL